MFPLRTVTGSGAQEYLGGLRGVSRGPNNTSLESSDVFRGLRGVFEGSSGIYWGSRVSSSIFRGSRCVYRGSRGVFRGPVMYIGGQGAYLGGPLNTHWTPGAYLVGEGTYLGGSGIRRVQWRILGVQGVEHIQRVQVGRGGFLRRCKRRRHLPNIWTFK